MKNAGDKGANHLSAGSIIILVAALSLIVAGVTFFAMQMRTQSSRWIQLSSSGVILADEWLAFLRAGRFDELQTNASTNLRGQLTEQRLHELQAMVQNMPEKPVVSGWTLHGGGTQMGLSWSGPQFTSASPRLDYRLVLPTKPGEPSLDLSMELTYENDRMVLDAVSNKPRLQAPAPPVAPAPAAPVPPPAPLFKPFGP